MRNLTLVRPPHRQEQAEKATHDEDRAANDRDSSLDLTSARTVTVEEAAAILGISRSHAYVCVKSGELPSLRLRRRIVVPVHALRQLLDLSG